MGVYDFFRGKCPSCDREVDEWSEFQTKWFSLPIPGQCFRDFFPGMHLPGTLPYVYTPIGETVCCGVEIDAVCYGTLLCGYRVHTKDDPIENDVKALYESGFVPQYDKRYETHAFDRFIESVKERY